jgi:hypothetical protein
VLLSSSIVLYFLSISVHFAVLYVLLTVYILDRNFALRSLLRGHLRVSANAGGNQRLRRI